MAKLLRISDDLSLPLDAVTEAIGMLASRRAGKSNGAVVLAEEMFKAGLHWVAIDPKGDWWGIRSSGDGQGEGLPIPILGGSHGDIPLEPGAGAMIADLIVDERLTCLLDVSGFASEAEKIRFLLAFGDRLFRRKQQGQEPTHVFFEEADDYVPQRAFPEQARLVHVMARILKQGGSRGLGGTVISQRSAVVHKDILSQIQTMITLRTTGPQDRRAIREWVSFSGENPEIVESLPGLADGEAWIWSPNYLRLTKRFQFRRRWTFDSGATPKIGESKRAPATLADVDLGALSTRMAETIERAKADDPAELRKRIRELERDASKATTEKVVERIEVPVLNGQVGDLRDAVRDLRDQGEVLGGFADAIVLAANSIVSAIDRVAAVPRSAPLPVQVAPSGVAERSRAPRDPARVPAAGIADERPVGALEAGEEGKRLDAGARRMLVALARLHPTPLLRSQLGTLADIAWTSGTFRGYLSSLRTAGLIDEPDKNTVRLSPAGETFMADSLGMGAPTVEELVEMWNRKLDAGARRMLRILVDLFPGGISRVELGQQAGIEATSGTFRGYLSKLRVNRLIDESHGDVRAGEALFIGGDR